MPPLCLRRSASGKQALDMPHTPLHHINSQVSGLWCRAGHPHARAEMGLITHAGAEMDLTACPLHRSVDLA